MASPTTDENNVFKMVASTDGVIFNMKAHFSSESEAREITDRYLNEWSVLIGFHHCDLANTSLRKRALNPFQDPMPIDKYSV